MVVEETVAVVMGKLADVDPASIVTVACTPAEKLELVSATVAPPAGAGSVKVTVPVELEPPTTLAGFKVMLESAGCAGTAVLPIRSHQACPP